MNCLNRLNQGYWEALSFLPFSYNFRFHSVGLRRLALFCQGNAVGDGEDRGESRGGKNKINDAIVGNVSRLNPLYEKKDHTWGPRAISIQCRDESGNLGLHRPM